jgi:hypothetical protein
MSEEGTPAHQPRPEGEGLPASGVRAEHTEEDGPLLAVELASRSPTADPGLWEMAWDVRNLGAEPLRMRAAWLPHGRFRAPRHTMDPSVAIEPRNQAPLAFAVLAREEPGTIVENCFLILNVDWSGTEWQVFARLTITFEAEGVPRPETVLITTQRTGFSA